jgi:hypothetical protein
MCMACDKAAVMVVAGNVTFALGRQGDHEPHALLVVDAVEARRLSRALTEAAQSIDHGHPGVRRRRRHARR